jgi:hypothetical protein
MMDAFAQKKEQAQFFTFSCNNTKKIASFKIEQSLAYFHHYIFKHSKVTTYLVVSSQTFLSKFLIKKKKK